MILVFQLESFVTKMQFNYRRNGTVVPPILFDTFGADAWVFSQRVHVI